MQKRSALTVAGAVAGALVSAVAGYSVRVGTTQAAPTSNVAVPTQKPVVKTVTTTITIHKKAKPRRTSSARSTQPITYVQAPTATTPVTHSGGSSTGGENESEGGGDD